jgi:hypothetical protein
MSTRGKPAGWRQGTAGELASEFLGTLIIIAFGTGSVAMSVAALNRSDRGSEAFQAKGPTYMTAQVLVARGGVPDPEIEEEGSTDVEEPTTA